MSAYLQTWTDGAQRSLRREGQPLEYAASNQYLRIGLEAGDSLFIGKLEDGYLHLIGRMRVAEILTQDAAVERFGNRVWNARWVAAADPQQSGRILRSREVPLDVVRRLQFLRRTGERTGLYPDSSGRIDGKALQSIRRLTPASAELLANLL